MKEDGHQYPSTGVRLLVTSFVILFTALILPIYYWSQKFTICLVLNYYPGLRWSNSSYIMGSWCFDLINLSFWVEVSTVSLAGWFTAYCSTVKLDAWFTVNWFDRLGRWLVLRYPIEPSGLEAGSLSTGSTVCVDDHLGRWLVHWKLIPQSGSLAGSLWTEFDRLGRWLVHWKLNLDRLGRLTWLVACLRQADADLLG